MRQHPAWEELQPPELEGFSHSTNADSQHTLTEQLPDYYWTWRMFVEGFSKSETAAIRRLTMPEIQLHLDQATRNGLLVNPYWNATQQE